MTVPSRKSTCSDEIVSPTASSIPHNKYNFPAVSAALCAEFRTTRRSGSAIVHSTTFTIASSREIELEFDSTRVCAQPLKVQRTSTVRRFETCESSTNDTYPPSKFCIAIIFHNVATIANFQYTCMIVIKSVYSS